MSINAPVDDPTSNSRRLTKVLDGVFGASGALIFAWLAVKWQRGDVPLFVLGIVAGYMAINILVSQAIYRTSRPGWFLILRMLLCGVYSPLILWAIPTGVGYVLGFLMSSIGAAALIGLSYSRRSLRVVLALWALDLAIASALLAPLDVEVLLERLATMLLAGVVIGEAAHLVRQSAARERESMQEVQLSRAKLLNSAKLAALGEMAGGVAHEINNPIAIIVMRATHIKRFVQELLAEPSAAADRTTRIVEYADHVIATSNRVATIVRGMRAVARAGDHDPLQDESVARVVRESLALCSADLCGKSIALVQELDETLVIPCRAVQISQVLLNLIANAAYELVALDDRDRRIEVYAFRDGEHAVVSVADNGRGIAPELLDKVMQPFFTTKPVGAGTGLGLSISRSILAGHGGSLEVESAPGRTVFALRMPMAKALARAG
jgi:signal transduction histidine kinase